MKFRPFFIPLAVLVFSCSIISEDAIDYIPSAARPKLITIAGPGVSLKGSVTYEGNFKSPSKITINWLGDTYLNRAPVANTLALNASTVYELTGGRVTKISNINSKNVASRVETLTYTPQGLILKNVQTNKTSAGDAMYEITNDFFYKGSTLDSVAQSVKWWDGAVWRGFVAHLNGEDHRPGLQSLYDHCTGGTSLQKGANYVNIMPYTPGQPYALSNNYQEYYNPATKQYEFSVNDFQKSFFLINEEESEFNVVDGTSFIQIQRYGEFVTDCSVLNLSMSWSIYGSNYSNEFLDNYPEITFVFIDKDSQTMNPIYYHLLLASSNQHHALTIQQADMLSMMNKKIEFLYLMEQRKNLPAAANIMTEATRKVDEFEYAK